jgi:protoheme ferro-lyase
MTSVALDPHNELVGVLVMSHGTPRSLEELPRFYTEIRRGRPPRPSFSPTSSVATSPSGVSLP